MGLAASALIALAAFTADSRGGAVTTPDEVVSYLARQIDDAELIENPCEGVLAALWRDALSEAIASAEAERIEADLESLVATAREALLREVGPVAADARAVFDPINLVFVLPSSDDRGSVQRERELRLAFTQDQFWRAFRVAQLQPQSTLAGAPAEAFELRQICAVDLANAQWLEANVCALVSSEAVRNGTIRATFTLLLHADARPALQLAGVLALAEVPLDVGYESQRRQMLARLADRLLLNQKNAQIFATVWRCEGGRAVHPGDTPAEEHIRASREAFSLPAFDARRQAIEAHCR